MNIWIQDGMGWGQESNDGMGRIWDGTTLMIRDRVRIDRDQGSKDRKE